MLTLMLAWIVAKYKWDYYVLFVGTFALDTYILGTIRMLVVK